MTDYNAQRRFIKGRLPHLVGTLPNRGKTIGGIFLHSTRGGRTAGDDGIGTENWAMHPDNKGAYWDGLVYESGQQVKCTHWELDENPQWAGGYGEPGTWNAQQYFIHIELAQGRIEDPFTPEQIESIAQWTAELSKVHNFPIVRIPFLSQIGPVPRGICDHENSANGKKLGKTDPGYMFPWDAYLARARELAGDTAMTADEKELFETLMLACFSGAEEAHLPREQRLKNAVYRMRQRTVLEGDEMRRSVADIAQSAEGLLKDATRASGGIDLEVLANAVELHGKSLARAIRNMGG